MAPAQCGPANPPLRPDFQIPGFAVASLRVGFDAWKDNRHSLQFFVNINNALNQRFREAYSQQQLYAPGFGAVIGVRVRM